jgi:hypothetical protein
MIIFKKEIPRRTFLRGLGVSVALPVLDAMVPALARASEIESKVPLRIGYVYAPNGIIRDRFRPAIAGANFEMSDMLKQWEPFRDQMLVLSNLNNGSASSVRGHVGGSSMFLTGVKPYKSLSNVSCGVSVDQIIAKEFNKETPLGSLQLCIENAAELAGQSGAGYSSAYTNTISWSNSTTPMPMVFRPRDVFERLFGDAGTDPQARKTRIQQQKSILDYIKDDFTRAKSKLGQTDRTKLDDFTDALRNIESRVQKAESKADIDLPEIARPVGIPEYEEHVRLMYDMILMAFKTDMTRVFTFMVAREFSELIFANLGHQEPYHPLTHHQGNPGKKRMAGEIDVYHAKLFSKLLAKMRVEKDIDGSSILDNSIIVFGSGMGDGDIHSQWNIPVALFGGGRGTLKGGRHIVYKEGTPLANLHVAMLNKIGMPTEKFGGELGYSDGELDLSRIA